MTITKDLPVYEEADLDLGKLDELVRGQALVLNHSYIPPQGVSMRLFADDLEGYEKAKEDKWALFTQDTRHRYRMYETLWGLYCKLNGQPFAAVYSDKHLKRDLLKVYLAEGRTLPLEAGDHLATFIRPFLVKRDTLKVTHSGVEAFMHDREKAQEIIVPVLDKVLEKEEPGETPYPGYYFTQRGRKW
jgi:hypothetical protein